MGSLLLLDAGSGGRASQRLVKELFLKYFGNDVLNSLDDAALLASARAPLAMSTDSYTVSPLFFPGASIGSLAINGTVNDVAMLGAKPLCLSCAFILEEGLDLAILEAIVADMANACQKADVKIVTGDTKVVPRGACDKIFITSTGLGEVLRMPAPSGRNAKAGDDILLSGPVGNHGLAVMAAREDLSFLSDARSDCAPLAKIVAELINNGILPHVLRDPSRGGLATTLNEIAEQSAVSMEIYENAIPVDALVRDGSSFLGLDPLYLANEGKFICILPPEMSEQALDIMHSSPYGKEAAKIGVVSASNPGKVILNTSIGGKRFLGMLEGAQLPRIC